MIKPEDIEIKVERNHHGMMGDPNMTQITATFEVSMRTDMDERLIGGNLDVIEHIKQALRRRVWEEIYDTAAFRKKVMTIARAELPRNRLGLEIGLRLDELLHYYDMPARPAQEAVAAFIEPMLRPIPGAEAPIPAILEAVGLPVPPIIKGVKANIIPW
jgi:hypothetical protein